MRKSLLCMLAITLLLSSVLLPLSAQAAQLVDVNHSCSLTLSYTKEGVCFPGLNIRIFRIAEFFSGDSYRLTGAFRDYPVRIHGVTSQKEWRDVANTLAAYVLADQIPPDHAALTDAQGTAAFTGLKTGIYLILGVTGENEKGTYQFENFLLFLPTPQENGIQNYDLTANPKGTFTPKPEEPVKPEPEQAQYRVLKLWNDTGIRNQRPDRVVVAILKDGTLQETVELHAGNNWSYSWSAPKGEGIWTVMEKDVPKDYTVVITTSDQHVFTITNSRTAPQGAPPKTGDTFLLQPWIFAFCISGMLLMAVGIWNKRKTA